ncbi:MAG: DNA/RNA nuclease SfsA, partial [Spirochaetaceae bacterium]|nr:DNA/RNA nuclease SfsA [Spirochaetaceae bacterium]
MKKKPTDTGSVRMFSNDLEAEFLRRPNRFLIIAGNNGEELPCHCPNPGRLEELLFPGVTLILEKRGSAGALKSAAKTGWTAAGLYHRESTAPLFSARANNAAEKLLLPTLIPGLKDVRREYTIGGSRFDFLCSDSGGTKHLIEVKACSLVEYGVAMFPDAPSSRALKHLEELASLAGEGYRCHILFVIVHGTPGVFIPNLHTDPEFSAALSRYSGRVNIHASLLRCSRDGAAELALPSVPVDLSHGALAAENRGSYLIVLEIPEETETAVGALGNLRFRKGWYVYAGSAQRNLSGRIARHLRKVRKKKHWHLDYLTPAAGTIKAF